MRRIFRGAGLQPANGGLASTPTTPTTPEPIKRWLGSEKDKQRPSTPPVADPSDDDWDSIKLPFANSIAVSDSPSLASLSPGSSTAVTAPSERGERVADTREDLIIELLAGQAMVEVEQGRWDVLSWDEVEDLRLVGHFYPPLLAFGPSDTPNLQELKATKKTMESLNRKLTLETAMLSASSFLERNPSTKRNGSIGAPSDNTRSPLRVESDKAKIATLTSELYKLSQKEADLRAKLLRHYSAALSSMLKKRDVSKSLVAESISSPSSSKTMPSLLSFEGPHLFASHLDAASPRSDPSLFSSLPMSPSGATEVAHVALENKYAELQAELERAKDDLKESRQELIQAEDYAARSREDARRLSEELTRLKESSVRQKAERDELKARCDRAEDLSSRLEAKLSVSKDQIDAAETRARTGANSGRQERERLREAVMGVLSRHKNRPGPLAAWLPEPPAADESDMVGYLHDTLDDHFVQMNDRLTSLETEASKPGLEDDLQQAEANLAKYKSETEFLRREKASIEASYRELQLRFQEEKNRDSTSLVTAERELRQARETEAQLRAELAENTSAGPKQLQELWRLLPPLNETRRALPDDADLRQYRDSIESGRRPRGDFSLDLRTQKFTVDALIDRVKGLIEDDKKLVDRLVRHEETQGDLKLEAERAQRMLDESLASYKKQVSNKRATGLCESIV
jgi:hypothetical protein